MNLKTDKMELTSKYRTRYPPKEHEEAVRMLLEGITKPSSQDASRDYVQSNHNINNSSSNNNNNNHGNDGYDCDVKSLTSIASSLSSEPVASSEGLTRMRSKATSTGDSVSTGSGAETNYKEPIPSRTVAVQCDLKSSSIKRDRLFDASMQASSISSTRYGFYNYSPETLETRRKLQRSVSSRDMGLISQTKGPERFRSQIEAPTSMSELSSSLSASDDDPIANLSTRKSEQDRKFSSSYNSSSESASKMSLNQRGDAKQIQESAERVARARINSLPRRPMTALSYVSTSKLREPRSMSRSGEESDLAKPLKSRAMSQQVLSQSQNTAYAQDDTSSESELNGTVTSRYQASPNNYQENRAEEMIILKRVQPQPHKPKSRLIATMHNEEIRDCSTLNNPVARTLLRERDRSTADELMSSKSDWREAPPDGDNWTEPARFTRSERVDGREGEISNQFNNNEPIKPPIPPKPEHSSDRHYHSGQENRNDGYYTARDNINRLNSMSLSRKPRNANLYDRSQAGYYTSSRIPHSLSRNDRAASNIQLTKPSTPLATSRRYTGQDVVNEVNRSTSMRQVERPITSNNAYIYDGPPRENAARKYSAGNHEFEPSNSYNFASAPPQRLYKNPQRNESEDSESPSTRTWANPNAKSDYDPERGRVLRDRKNMRSYSMRDVNNAEVPRVTRYQEDYDHKNEFVAYTSSSESSALESAPRFVRSHPLDYDSQHRLNESGLPEVNTTMNSRESDDTQSYLRMTSQRGLEGDLLSHYPASRSTQIRGRAMSQQSLTRPTMPITSARRRGGSNPGSDVGGSSMSLVSRLHGRYENAHTRSPVVMYIPQVAPKPSFLTDTGIEGKTGTLRRSSRVKRKSSSQDRSRKSSVRNGSDSESSSMLRTLVRRKSRQGSHLGRRTARMQSSLYNDEEEDLDGVGQLATEVDTYKFRRRYSVPKDAKINWFAKLKQRVTSGGR